MLELRQAREIKGTVTVPPCPDLYFLTACIAAVTGAEAHIASVPESPLIDDLERRLVGHLDIERSGAGRLFRPCAQADAPAVTLPYPDLPHADLVVFMLLGAGKTLMFDSLPQTMLDRWQRLARTVGCSITVNASDNRTALYLPEGDSFGIPDVYTPPNALHPYLGMALGKRAAITLTTEYPFVSPLRHILPAFGIEPTVRGSAAKKDSDPLAKRLRFLGVKRKEQTEQFFTTTIDFSAQTSARAEIDIPGDSVLAAVMMLAKAVVQRGALVIENVPLESWAGAMTGYIRKMGCKIGVQETRRSSFGSTGMVQLQNFTVIGRKSDCVPLYQFVDLLPPMVVLSCFAAGQSVFRSLDPLRDERPDPIEQMLYCVRTLGARHGEMPDGMVIDGAQAFDGFDLLHELPASMAASCAVGALRCSGASTVADTNIIRRWPRFKELLDKICVYRT